MRSVVLLSGGLDSTAMLGSLRHRNEECYAITVVYGQKHVREIEAAKAVAKHYGIGHEIIQLPASLMKGSALTGKGDVPQGHYTDPSMKTTVVANRNMVLLSLAGAVAVRQGANRVAYAAHAGDHAVYPDCRPEFATAMQLALRLCDYNPIELYAPFIDRTKADIVKIGHAINVPFDLTWSCYEGGSSHCGRCGTCTERIEAFALAGVTDQTEYLK